MTRIENIIAEMNPVASFVLCAGVALSAVLVGLFHYILYNAGSRSRKRFWLILIMFLLMTMIRLIIRSLRITTPDVNLFIDSLFQACLILFLIVYVRKTYVHKKYMTSEGCGLEQACFFDIEDFLSDLRQSGSMTYEGMRIDLLPEEHDTVACIRVTVLKDVKFPYQYHHYTETISVEWGNAHINGHLLRQGKAPFVIPANMVHNIDAIAGTIFISRLHDKNLTDH